MTGNNKVNVVATERDLRVFQELADAKILDREQYQIVAAIRSVNRANDRLNRLHRAGLLRRHFLGTQAGGRKGIYSLAPAAATLIGLTKLWRFQHPENDLLIADGFTAHQIAVNWVRVSAKYRLLQNVEFLRWRSFSEPLCPIAPLIPDGYFEVRCNGSTLAHFIEADLGTETAKAWDRKTQLYVKLAASGDFVRLFGQNRFRVLVSAPSERRLGNIRAVVARHTPRIFFFLDCTTIHRDGIWTPAWLRPLGDQRQPLT